MGTAMPLHLNPTRMQFAHFVWAVFASTEMPSIVLVNSVPMSPCMCRNNSGHWQAFASDPTSKAALTGVLFAYTGFSGARSKRSCR